MPFDKKKYLKEYYYKNRESALELKREYYVKNKKRIKEYQIKNKARIRAYSKKYNSKNKVRIREYHFKNRERIKRYRKQYLIKKRELTRKSRREYERERRKADELYKLIHDVRARIRNSLRSTGYRKTGRTAEILGCSYDFFKEYIQSKFTKGMSWDNSGKWHYDHIIPVSSAKTKEEVIRLNHYTNFQPLWAIDNMKKGCKII